MFYELARQKRADVFFLQETHSDPVNAVDWAKEWDGLVILSHNSTVSGGVGVLFSSHFIPHSYTVDDILPGRLLTVRACYENETFVFICVYAPTVGVERMGFLDRLSTLISNCDFTDFLVLGGDFNCTADILDRNHLEPHAASCRRLCELLEAHDLCDWWDVAKVQIRVFCQQYTFNVTRDIIRSLKALETEIVALQCLAEATGDQEHIKVLKRKKAVLADLLGITAQGALVRSRFLNVMELDAPSKFFFGLERKNGQKRFMHAVRSESGDLVSEPSEIRQQTVSFFSKLFESEQASSREVEERFFPLQARIAQQSATLLDAELSLGELVREGKLPLSCRRAVLTLLPKKGDLTVLKNWRPVALLCTDCKLLSKALASRLGKVMEQVVHLDQTYCVPVKRRSSGHCSVSHYWGSMELSLLSLML
ncbi:hypothetical protein MHYP_G00351550 [Metynnis hypsauchen]